LRSIREIHPAKILKSQGENRGALVREFLSGIISVCQQRQLAKLTQQLESQHLLSRDPVLEEVLAHPYSEFSRDRI